LTAFIFARVPRRVSPKALGWHYQYEPEGFAFEQGSFLPDFYLTECDAFVEVKGIMPSDHEISLCASLANERNCTVFLAVGQPEAEIAVYRFPLHGDSFISSLRTELRSLGASYDEIARAIFCARSGRFEFGEKPVTHTDPRLANLVNARREHRNLSFNDNARSADRLPEVWFVPPKSKDGR
jgi:hypothetical protein